MRPICLTRCLLERSSKTECGMPLEPLIPAWAKILFINIRRAFQIVFEHNRSVLHNMEFPLLNGAHLPSLSEIPPVMHKPDSGAQHRCQNISNRIHILQVHLHQPFGKPHNRISICKARYLKAPIILYGFQPGFQCRIKTLRQDVEPFCSQQIMAVIPIIRIPFLSIQPERFIGGEAREHGCMGKEILPIIRVQHYSAFTGVIDRCQLRCKFRKKRNQLLLLER